MTSRQQRRAQERKSRKQANRTARPLPETMSTRPVELALAALSNGADLATDYAPLIAAASLAILLPGEEPELYRAHLGHFFRQHLPVSGVESEIVKRLADLQWRLARIAGLEAGVLALGRRKYADLFTESDPALCHALVDAHTLVVDGLPLKRLHLQETRLRRFYANDLAELKDLQERRQDSRSAANESSVPAQPASLPVLSMERTGFEFTDDYELDLAGAFDPASCLEFLTGSEFSSSPDLIAASSK